MNHPMGVRIGRGVAVAAMAWGLVAASLLCGAAFAFAAGLLRPSGRTIHGEVVMKPSGASFKDANLLIFVEDVSVKDARARYLAKKEIRKISHDGRPNSVLRFKIEDLKPEPGHRYQVRVLVDLDRNGRISRGDYRSVRATSVFTEKDRDPLVVEVELKRE